MAAQPEIHYSACPHDCPSTCALEVERLGTHQIGKVRGAVEKLRELSPLWDMYKAGIDLNSVEWVAH